MTDKFDFIILRLSSKDTLKRVRVKATEWEEIFEVCIQWTLPRIFLSSHKSIRKRADNPIKKNWEKDLNGHKKLIQMANQHIKRHWTSLVIEEWKWKPQLDITISDTSNIGKDCGATGGCTGGAL